MSPVSVYMGRMVLGPTKQRPSLLALLVVMQMAPTSGCCLFIGAGIGDTIPRRGDVVMPAEISALAKGTEVTVVYRAPEKDGRAALKTIEGVYRGMEDDRALVERGPLASQIPLSRIESTQARPPNGTHSLEGGLIGLGLDIALAAALYGIVSSGAKR